MDAPAGGHDGRHDVGDALRRQRTDDQPLAVRWKPGQNDPSDPVGIALDPVIRRRTAGSPSRSDEAAGCDQLPAVDDGHPIAEAFDLAEQVGVQDHARAPRFRLADD